MIFEVTYFQYRLHKKFSKVKNIRDSKFGGWLNEKIFWKSKKETSKIFKQTKTNP